jgi:hypothetical protein
MSCILGERFTCQKSPPTAEYTYLVDWMQQYSFTPASVTFLSESEQQAGIIRHIVRQRTINIF